LFLIVEEAHAQLAFAMNISSSEALKLRSYFDLRTGNSKNYLVTEVKPPMAWVVGDINWAHSKSLH